MPSNFRRETLTFEVVGFRGTYHAVLGRPCYAKFMSVPNYTYLKLKMPGPNGVITVGPTYKHAFECDVECVEYAEALAESEALIADMESLSKEVPDVKRHADNFEPVETVKAVPLDPSGEASKQIRISSGLDPKWEAVLVDFLRANTDVFAWSPSDLPGIPRDVAEHSPDIRAGARPVKQPLRRFDEEKRRVIGEEIHKLKEAKSVKPTRRRPRPSHSTQSPCWGHPGATRTPGNGRLSSPTFWNPERTSWPAVKARSTATLGTSDSYVASTLKMFSSCSYTSLPHKSQSSREGRPRLGRARPSLGG
jgi:hypothetical protein